MYASIIILAVMIIVRLRRNEKPATIIKQATKY
jgi:hypothetical protein